MGYQRILITGGSGRIGKGVVNSLDYLFVTQSKIDLLQNKRPVNHDYVGRHKLGIIEDLSDKKYDFALHLAANADTAYCAKPENKERVWEANVGLTKKVCDASDKVLFVSTDQVGSANVEEGLREGDFPRPCSVYGKSKLDGEKVTLDSNGNVIRIGTMLGVSNRIVDHAVDVISGKTSFAFFTNDYLRPSYLQDFLQTVKTTVDLDRRGEIFHAVCNGRNFSRHEIASRVLQGFLDRNLPASVEEIEGCESANPRMLVLNNEDTEYRLSLDFCDSEEALKKHIDCVVEANRE